MPTPEHRSKKKLSRIVSQKMAFMDLSQLDRFMTTVNRVRGCNTPDCKGGLMPVQVLNTGLGGALCITYVCDGCQFQRAEFKASSVCKLINASECVQTAFIIAGCTHATYYKVLQHALGIEAVSMDVFMHTIRLMFPVVKAMLDEVCEFAKQDMKDMGNNLGSWTRAVTSADGVWHTRRWHTKNATFSIRNYFNGALVSHWYCTCMPLRIMCGVHTHVYAVPLLFACPVVGKGERREVCVRGVRCWEGVHGEGS